MKSSPKKKVVKMRTWMIVYRDGKGFPWVGYRTFNYVERKQAEMDRRERFPATWRKLKVVLCTITY